MNITEKDFTIGADPELFLRHTTKPGRPFVSAHGLIPGTKKEPYKVQDGAIQVDGNAVEYNIDPCKTEDEFVARNASVLKTLSSMLPDYELVNRPYVDFNKNVWDKIPEEAKELGCDPDYNAYTGNQNPNPGELVRVSKGQSSRTAAGHIHIGWTKDMDVGNPGHLEACKILIRELDLRLGVPSALLEYADLSAKRRILYGKAGAFRPKPYGVEYRVLSNFWVGNEELTRWIYQVCFETFVDLLKGRVLTRGITAQNINNVLRSSDIEYRSYFANQYIHTYGLHVPKGLKDGSSMKATRK